MYKIFTNILTKGHLENLIEIAKFEIKYFLCSDVPKYQTYNFMHKKYKHTEAMHCLTNFAKHAYYTIYNDEAEINACWFNILKKDSNFKWHAHSFHTVVFYLYNPNSDGTMIEDYKLPGIENSAYILEPNIIHKIPQWNNTDRITIALELSK